MKNKKQEIVVQQQFSIRATTFNNSVNWITDPKLLYAHVKAAGRPGKGLELCCGTGIIGRVLKENGWDMTGVDITKEMLDEASRFFNVVQHNVEDPLHFNNNVFDMVIMRQALFFFEPMTLLSEVKRVLKSNGKFVLSQCVPFEDSEDEKWLKKLHLTKQALMLKFYTINDIETILIKSGFKIISKKQLSVRESVSRWMKNAPEMTESKKNEVMNLIRSTPLNLQKFRDVSEDKGELMENWNWVIFNAR
ncbi:MAG: class I SAM-dependent methyltransferase [Ignavibacteriaceae bacterium]